MLSGEKNLERKEASRGRSEDRDRRRRRLPPSKSSRFDQRGKKSSKEGERKVLELFSETGENPGSASGRRTNRAWAKKTRERYAYKKEGAQKGGGNEERNGSAQYRGKGRG